MYLPADEVEHAVHRIYAGRKVGSDFVKVYRDAFLYHPL